MVDVTSEREIAVTREILLSKFRTLSCGTASTSGSRERRWTTVMDPSPGYAIIIMGAQRDDITWFGPPYCGNADGANDNYDDYDDDDEVLLL